jgi:hypothetical protein
MMTINEECIKKTENLVNKLLIAYNDEPVPIVTLLAAMQTFLILLDHFCDFNIEAIEKDCNCGLDHKKILKLVYKVKKEVLKFSNNAIGVNIVDKNKTIIN